MGKKKDAAAALEKSQLMSTAAPGFIEKVTPKPLPDTLFLFKCPHCGGAHFRHAGYVETQVPFIRGVGEKSVLTCSESVKVCVSCKHSYIWVSEQVYDISDKIDLDAWQRTEVEAHRATGPGGQC